jgi:hypothetical protein
MTSRRDTLRALGSLAALPFLSRLEIDRLLALGHRALTPAQHEIVEAAAERIIPRTATPGATDAGVADFIDVMLADWYSQAERDRFVAGVTALERRGFARMTVEQQTQLLQTFDSARSDGDWFAMLKHLTVWGYYTSRVGVVDELRVQLNPGRYDGNAPY